MNNFLSRLILLLFLLAMITSSISGIAETDSTVSKPRAANASAEFSFTLPNPGLVSWVHFGDLHITGEREQNYSDFNELIKQANRFLSIGVNFAVLPGDNADDGSESEYQLIRKAIDQLRIPLFIVPGDHDLKTKSLALYLKYLEPVAYQSFALGAYRFIFLDALDKSPQGGFGLSPEQLNWLSGELDSAEKNHQRAILYEHAFPHVLERSAQDLQKLISSHHVLMVDVGHTHYNEVANDGKTIYAATRSTGQITEGPVGFSIANLDNGVVSWKFKPLGSWPFVMITSPADKRFIVDESDPNQVLKGSVQVHARVWHDEEIAEVKYQIDGGASHPLSRDRSGLFWTAFLNTSLMPEGEYQLSVESRNRRGQVARDKILIAVKKPPRNLATSRQAGAEGNSIGVDADKGLLGTKPPPKEALWKHLWNQPDFWSHLFKHVRDYF